MTCRQPKMRAIILLRLYITVNILISAMLIATGRYKHITSVMTDTATGNFVLTGIIFLASIALFDSLINDILPRDFTSDFTMRWRVLGYMGLSICMGSAAFLLIITSGKSFILLRALLDSSVCAGTAFLGLREVMYNHLADRRHSNI